MEGPEIPVVIDVSDEYDEAPLASVEVREAVIEEEEKLGNATRFYNQGVIRPRRIVLCP